MNSQKCQFYRNKLVFWVKTQVPVRTSFYVLLQLQLILVAFTWRQHFLTIGDKIELFIHFFPTV